MKLHSMEVDSFFCVWLLLLHLRFMHVYGVAALSFLLFLFIAEEYFTNVAQFGGYLILVFGNYE